MKVKIPNESKYYYPDIIVTKEPQTNDNNYVQFQPELLAEVISEFSRNKDMVDKLIQYQKFPSLKYYLIAESEKQQIIVVSRNAEGSWQSETFDTQTALIALPALEAELKINEVYNS
ncbi:MAG: Uma2 family endonuclease [Parafilimonas sp.]